MTLRPQMEAELGVFSRDNKELLLEMDKQKLRLDATSKELMRERQLVSHLKSHSPPKKEVSGCRPGTMQSESHISSSKSPVLARIVQPSPH